LLVSLDGQNGQIRFQQPLTYSNTYQGNNTIGVYDSGVVVVEDNASSSFPDLLSYYSYAGNKDNTLSCAIDSVTDSCGFSYSGSSIGSIRRILVEPSGTTYLEVWGGTCSTRYKFKYTVGGVGSTIASPTSCIELVRIMPNGNRVFSDGSTVVVTDSSGVTQYSGGLASKPGYTFIRNPYPVDLQIDGNGDVVVLRYARLNTSSVRHVYVDRLNANSTWTTLFSTEQLPNPNGNSFYLEPAYEVPNVAFAKDYMYLAVCRAACSSTNGPIVSKISMPGMEVEYPRSAMFAKYALDNGEQLNYVALGDSFSSGEGVPPFGSSTAITGVNECHRSSKAYPGLIDQIGAYDLNLTAFRACSGAKMENITTTGQYNESAQVSSLSDETDFVTITIGGNDVEFREVGYTCNYDHGTSNCLDQLTTSTQIATSQGFRDDLYDTLEAVELAAPNAGVIVNGYPYILSTPGDSYPCGWAFQTISTAEQEAIEGLVDEVNDALSDTATLLGMVYIDPRASFHGHYPCHSYPYIQGVNLGSTAYSYHPTEEGQLQYQILLDGWLS
jgi:hypothetical protein